MSRLHREPVRHTCPDIDAIIADIKDMDSLCQYADDIDIDTAKELLENISNILHFIPRKLEDLRTANSMLRDWGNGLCGEIDDLESEKADLENKINELESQIFELENK